ncbi:WAT1-related protein At1g43650-like isoform X1 [Salvia miltiorrhiza]|uniref:WAT1-related protein At1g43650-like isoform X1 n=1 Tax=Salvia miltiorrhiza TaxID=226208 RepID=UPI0025AC6B8D|nr:WAT1-related protein At1g43650-like isoform X1 [Salvia miltiorrhiza]
MGKSFNMVKILEKKKAYIVMILVQLAYAGMSLFSKTSINKGMNPFVFVAYRQAFATLALLPFALFLDRKKGRDSLTYSLLWKIFLVSLFGITLSLNLYIYAINYVSATFASASNNSIPAFTFAIAVGLRIERFSIRDLSGIVKLVGAVVSFSGAMVFAFVKGPQFSILNLCEATRSMRNPSTDFSSEEKWIQGCLLMLLANIIWASWLVMQAPLVKQYPAKFGLTMLQCLFSCLQSTVWGIAMQRDISWWKLTWDFNLLSVAYCGVVVTGISYWLFLWAVESKGPLFTASFTPLQLIFTATFSAFLWNEMLHIGSICGGMLLVGGLYCVLWGKKREEEVEKEADKGTMDETHV